MIGTTIAVASGAALVATSYSKVRADNPNLSIGQTVSETVAETVSRARATIARDDEELIRIWEARHHAQRPQVIVPRLVTPFPGPNPRSMKEFARLCAEITNSVKAGKVLAVHANIESGFENPHLWCYNPGNFDWVRSRDASAPAFVIRDRGNAVHFSRAFGSWQEGIRYWVTVILGLPRYAGSLDAAKNGDLRGYCAILGRGGYAASYKSGTYLDGRYERLVRSGRLDRI